MFLRGQTALEKHAPIAFNGAAPDEENYFCGHARRPFVAACGFRRQLAN